MNIRLDSYKIFQSNQYQQLDFICRLSEKRRAGSCLWMFFDIRQNPGNPQSEHPDEVNYLTASTEDDLALDIEIYNTRSLDLYPKIPEFFYACRIGFTRDMNPETSVIISLGKGKGWRLPNHPIGSFSFWFFESDSLSEVFHETGYRTYRHFDHPHPELLQERIEELSIKITGRLPEPELDTFQETPGVLWGDIHAMVFNQRPLDNFYNYAKYVARLDFAAAMLFSYNTCIPGTWDRIKAAARRWNQPGEFLPVVGFEAATVPDGSHRNAYFFDPDGVPPIFCEDRPPANDPRYLSRLSPETVFCPDLPSYYSAVREFDGIVTGHFHTLDYQEEILAEVWQKQVGDEGDEPRLFNLLNQGHKFGIVGGSDTHDSMPGNPQPEPHCPQPAGFMAVISDSLDAESLKTAIISRRVYATSGARIYLKFNCHNYPMGSVLPGSTPKEFFIEVKGTANLLKVELIHCGETIRIIKTENNVCSTKISFPNINRNPFDWYLIKVTQEDGHRAWSSPIWFEN